MRTLLLTLVAACAATLLPAAAQTLKPGLWEMQQKTSGDPQMDQRMAEMRQQMEAMPPQQRKQMEAMMGGGGVTRVRFCLTPEMAQRNEIAFPAGDCQSRQQRSGNELRVAYTCTRPRSKGDMQITLTGAEAFAIHSTSTSDTGGKPQTLVVDGTGRWLAADCGDVKPIQSK